MKAFRNILPLAACAALGVPALVACSDDDDTTTVVGDGDGDGDGTGGMMGGDGDGDGDGGAGGATSDCSSILEIAGGNDDFSILVDAVTKAGLADALAGEDLTVFAPTNAAFADLLETLGLDSLDDLSAEQLTPILMYHVADSVVPASAAISVANGAGSFDTLGGTITLDVEGDDLVIDSAEFAATVTTTDVEACNGVVHIIDGVIVPDVVDIVTTSALFSGEEGEGSGLGLADLVPASSAAEAVLTALRGPNITLFAPSNAAVGAVDPVPAAADITTILQYHVFNGTTPAPSPIYAADVPPSTVTLEMLAEQDLDVDGSSGVVLTDTTDTTKSVTIADLYASNGVIHVIDGVLIPTL